MGPICRGCKQHSHPWPCGCCFPGLLFSSTLRICSMWSAHWLCSRPSYWFIWAISEENVTKLCRKCCNWISATGIIWRFPLECVWKPPLVADSERSIVLWMAQQPPQSAFPNWGNGLKTCALAIPSFVSSYSHVPGLFFFPSPSELALFQHG